MARKSPAPRVPPNAVNTSSSSASNSASERPACWRRPTTCTGSDRSHMTGAVVDCCPPGHPTTRQGSWATSSGITSHIGVDSFEWRSSYTPARNSENTSGDPGVPGRIVDVAFEQGADVGVGGDDAHRRAFEAEPGDTLGRLAALVELRCREEDGLLHRRHRLVVGVYDVVDGVGGGLQAVSEELVVLRAAGTDVRLERVEVGGETHGVAFRFVVVRPPPDAGCGMGGERFISSAVM